MTEGELELVGYAQPDYADNPNADRIFIPLNGAAVPDYVKENGIPLYRLKGTE